MNQPAARTWRPTGVSRTGRTTLAHALTTAWQGHQQSACMVDADGQRADLCQDIGLDAASQGENVCHATHTARPLNDSAAVHRSLGLAL